MQRPYGDRIAEYLYDPVSGASELLREYVWMDGRAVAVIEGGQVFFVRTDHIGRPVFATDSDGLKVWEASYLPFGGVHVSTGAIALRFPGQWFQSESGLHQNWMRDYDPTTGRYLQADPLGLVDGASVYGYALGNPGRWVDPRGLFVGIPASNPGAFFGNAMDFYSGVLGYFSGLYKCGEYCNNVLYEELWRRINAALDTNARFRACILDAILEDMARHPFYYAGRGITAAGATKALGAVSTPVSGAGAGAALTYLSIKGDVLASIASGVDQLDPRKSRGSQPQDVPLLHQFPADELCKCIRELD